MLISFGNEINTHLNSLAVGASTMLKLRLIPGVTDIVPAYASVAVHYDIEKVKATPTDDRRASEIVCDWIGKVVAEVNADLRSDVKHVVKVQVCYSSKYAPDMPEVMSQTKLTAEEIINLHTSKFYDVYMLGFLPGFAYMGTVHKKIEVSRKSQPSARIEAGSVGIAGKQTGIYPLTSPGGWQIIGRTPIKIFDKDKDNPVFFEPGQYIQFVSISEDEFENYQGGII